jgi:hypothetical protein
VASLTTLPLAPAQDTQAVSQPTSATPTTSTRIAFRNITAKPPANGSPLRTLTALKTDLRIDGWQCGAETRNNTPCKRSIKCDKRKYIDAQLAAMKSLTCASPSFESDILKLVMLVHCHSHDAGQPKERRLEAWKLAFSPVSDDGTALKGSIERVRKVFEPLNAECIAHDNEQACKQKVGGQKVQNFERTLQKLINPEIYMDNGELVLLLKVLEWNRTCNIHESSMQFTRLAAWKESLMSVLPLPSLPTRRALPSKPSNELRVSPNTQSNPPIGTAALTAQKASVLNLHVLPNSQASLGPGNSTDADPALYWPKAYDTSLFNIVARVNPDVSPTRSHERIRTAIQKSLISSDLRDGHVYSYEVEGNEGYVKIGYTTRPLTERYNEWSFNCNRQTKPLYPAFAQAAVTVLSTKEPAAAWAGLVPHARRVEALCHAELDHRRIRIYCDACLTQHLEWFEVSPAEAKAVIQKWSRWIATEPYELLHLREPKWTLKVNERRRMSKFERFMNEIEVLPETLQK